MTSSHATASKMNSTHSEPPLSTLHPAAHRERFLHLQTCARYAGPSDPTTRLNSILVLLESYRNAVNLTSLLPHDWDVFLALETRLAAASSPLTPVSLQALFELHKTATTHYQSAGLIKRYISLVLAYFAQLHGIEFPLSPLDRNEGSTAKRSSAPALKWTSLDSCPAIDAAHSMYKPDSLPPLARESVDPAVWQEICGIEAVRWRIREAYTRCAYQLQESQDVWKLFLAFEQLLLSSGQVAQDQQLETLRHVYLARLKVPHAQIDDTFQAFSSFVTNHLPPQQYEAEMSAANVLVAESRSIFRQREQYEDALASLFFRTGNLHTVNSRQDIDHFASYCKPYLRWQTNRAMRTSRSKDKALAQIELDLTCGLYERLLPHFGLHPPSSHKHELVYYSDDVSGSENYSRDFKRLTRAERDERTAQEQQLLTERLSLATDLWLDYISILTSAARPDASLIMDVCMRSTQCLPTVTQLHCVLMRNSTRFRRSKLQIEQLFEKIVTPGALELKAAELTDVCLARVDCERELASYDLVIKTGSDVDVDPAHDMEKFTEIYDLLSYALSKLADVGEERDPTLRLELCTVSWVERAVFAMGGPNSEVGAGLNELAESVWQTAVTQQPDNALVYKEAAAYWIRRFDAKKARAWFKAGVSKLERKQNQQRDAVQDRDYQRLLEEWVMFEHQSGRTGDVEYAESKARMERQRALEAWYAQYAQYGNDAQAQQAAAHVHGEESSETQVEAPQADHFGAGKRKADDDEDLADASITDTQMSTCAEEAHRAPDTSAFEQPKKTRTNEADTGPTRDREHCSVLVSNLPPATDAASVRSFLRGCGRVVELSGPTVLTASDGTTSAAALVEFSDPTGSTAALTRHNKFFNDSHVFIFIGWKCTLFVTNFPEDWDDTLIRNAFSPHGLIFSVRWPSKRFVSTRRFCYVQFTTPDAAASAVAGLNKCEVAPGRQLNVALSDPSRRKQRSDAPENAKELFVSGFPRNVKEDEFKAFFEEFGTVKGVRLLRNQEGGLRGIGFVDFESLLDAHRAMRELNSTKWRGKTISVTIAENRGAHGTRHIGGESKKSGMQDRKERSVRVQGLPVDAQEALIQQAVERAVGLGTVKQVLWRPDGTSQIATVELKAAADAGKAVLLGGAGKIRYNDQHMLTVVATDDDAADVAMLNAMGSSTAEPQAAAAASSLVFAPRASRGGRGRGRGRAFGMGFSQTQLSCAQTAATSSAGDDMEVEPTVESTNADTGKLTGQDRFRALLQR
ncbi:uncharacterized protein MEPE_02267 [Melanopsichium pennsylvanicum]|uniref:U4/U6 snRNA-associated-splicing factor PRP24 n=2 Tax=Melanopsichium pennsylvanicum TaxID=63383 RepID=A0AAJ4XK01_9BASI|nr:conserved hypothetical protein [Melanopsichium pennsylvanicum 4]SNX83560.1 uncharacterized protein MEPE_02267 [Melanopsichium pennsylvanicum]